MPASRRWPRRRCARTRRGRPRACGHLDRPRAQRATRVLPRGGHRPAGANRRRRRRATRADRRRTPPAPARRIGQRRARRRRPAGGRRAAHAAAAGERARGPRRRRGRRSPRSRTRSSRRARRVWLAGWFFSPGFRARPDRRADAARAARGRGASGSTCGCSPGPARRCRSSIPTAARSARRATGSRAATRVRVALDARERPLHCHHEKLVIVDGEVAFVGGIDLTSLAGDRLDTSDAPAARRRSAGTTPRPRIRGPAVADVAAHFALRWPEVTGEQLPAPAPRPGRAATSSCRSCARCPSEIYDAAPARRVRDPRVVPPARSARRGGSSTSRTSSSGRPRSSPCWRTSCATRRTTASGSSSSCPSSRTTAATTRAGSSACSRPPTAAPAGSSRARSCSAARAARPCTCTRRSAIVDDRWLTVGSANLNEHSLFNDTEMNVVTPRSGARARDAAAAVERASRAPDAAELEGDPTRARRRASGGRRRPSNSPGSAPGRPAPGRLVELPGVSRRLAGIRGPLNGLIVDG